MISLLLFLSAKLISRDTISIVKSFPKQRGSIFISIRTSGWAFVRSVACVFLCNLCGFRVEVSALRYQIFDVSFGFDLQQEGRSRQVQMINYSLHFITPAMNWWYQLGDDFYETRGDTNNNGLYLQTWWKKGAAFLH